MGKIALKNSMTICKNCKAEYKKYVNKCPACGARIDPPKWAMAVSIVVMVLIGIFVVSLFTHSGSSTQTAKSTSTAAGDNSPKDLKADIRVSSDSLEIINNDTTDWKSCKLELNASGVFDSGWTNTQDVIAAKDSVDIPFSDFTKGDGTMFNPNTTKPQSISINCSDAGGGKPGFASYAAK